MKTQKFAEKHSAHCFLNSLLREWHGYIYEEKSSSFQIALSNNEILVIPVKSLSLVGRHEYEESFYIQNALTKKNSEIDFLEMVHKILGHLQKDYQVTPSQLNTFVARIENSLSNMSVAMDSRATEIKHSYEKTVMDFKEAEQLLMVGHSFHPHPKNRDEFDQNDYKKFGPETGGEFTLNWFLVRPEVLHHQVSNNFFDKNWTEKLFSSDERVDIEFSTYLKDGYKAFPVHPWQREILLKNKDIKAYIIESLIVDFGERFSEEKWTATSSLRSIYRKSSPYMLKFSLSVRLTNSIRHLLPLEVVRGLQVMDVCATQAGQEFLAACPDFHILYEPAFMALLDKNKQIINESIVAMRLNPFDENHSDQKMVLATLTQDHPFEGESLIGSMIKLESSQTGMKLTEVGKKWFELFLEKAVRPLLIAQANYGILFGAHQQNLVIAIKNNKPDACYFRDCQGTGYGQKGFELFSASVDLMVRENGNILEDKMGNILFSYYLIINSTFNVIATIAKDSRIKESELMKCLRENLLIWRASGVKDTTCFDYLLNEKTLYQKGNFLCSFVNLNENTTADPLSIYNEIPNPIYEAQLC